MSGSTRETATPQEISLADLLRFVHMRRTPILLGAVLGISVGALYTFESPRRYTSTVTVELNKDANSGLGIQDLSGADSSIGSSAQFQTELLTHETMLLDDNTALAVIDDLNLMAQRPYSEIPRVKAPLQTMSVTEDPRLRDRALSIFRSGLRVDTVKNTTLLKVSYTDRDPDRAMKIANGVVQAYLEDHSRARFNATSSASRWLTVQLENLKRKVEENHDKVAAFEQTNGVVASSTPLGKGATGGISSAQDPNSTAIQRLTALNSALSKAEIARIEAEAAYRLTQTDSPDAVLQASMTRLADGSGEGLAISARNVQLLESLRSEASGLNVRLAAALNQYGAQFPEVQSLRTQLATVQGQIQHELTRINHEARTSFVLAKANEDQIRKSTDEQQRAVFAIGNSLTALTFLQQEENTSRGLYQDLYTRLEEANVAAGIKSTDMVVVNPARVSSEPSSPALPLDLAAGLASGTAAGLLIGLVLHLRDASLYAPEEFALAWTAPLLGVIPWFDTLHHPPRAWLPQSLRESGTDRKSTDAWLLTAPRSRTAEAYRQIRTSILHAGSDAPAKVLLIASPLARDGKSTIAYNLAVAFALQGERVLLIDADMRNPSLPAFAGAVAEAGLSDFLVADSAWIGDIAQPHPALPNLNLISAGSRPSMPAELLGSPAFAHLIEDVREQYDHILIDTPPALLVTDPLVIAPHADGVVAVLRAGATTRMAIDAFSEAFQGALGKSRLRLFGYVVNAVHAADRRYDQPYRTRSTLPSNYYQEVAAYKPVNQ